MNKDVIKSVTQILCMQQVTLELLEQLPDDNIFVQRNKKQTEDFIELLEHNVEQLTSVMNTKQSDNYIYICKNLHKVIGKIKGL